MRGRADSHALGPSDDLQRHDPSSAEPIGGSRLSDHLSQARPSTPLRQVFLAAKAPTRPIPPGLVSDVTHRACDRAGLPRSGAHRLRHTLATEMLRRGASIVEVSQVLRHRDLATTAIYAKVDVATLRGIAQPWPGARR